jgi:hypothetical protein
MDTIDDAYKYVAGQEKEWRCVHIGGKLYASVSSGYPCVHLRYFFRSDDDRIIPSRNGVTLTLPMWENMKKFAVELREAEPDLKNASLCMLGTDHSNQMGFLQCGECNPFFDPFTPTLAFPPMYNSFLEVMKKLD